MAKSHRRKKGLEKLRASQAEAIKLRSAQRDLNLFNLTSEKVDLLASKGVLNSEQAQKVKEMLDAKTSRKDVIGNPGMFPVAEPKEVRGRTKDMMMLDDAVEFVVEKATEVPADV